MEARRKASLHGIPLASLDRVPLIVLLIATSDPPAAATGLQRGSLTVGLRNGVKLYVPGPATARAWWLHPYGMVLSRYHLECDNSWTTSTGALPVHRQRPSFHLAMP